MCAHYSASLTHLEQGGAQGGEELSRGEVETFQRIATLGLEEVVSRNRHQRDHTLCENNDITLETNCPPK